MHRIGGIEKEDGSGNISYEADNHEHMVKLRARKVAGIAKDIPPAEVSGHSEGDVLVIGWGSTWGAIDAAVEAVRADGERVGHVHLVHLNPMPPGLGEIISRFDKVLVPEMNLGQLVRMIRAEFLVDATPLPNVRGAPFTSIELQNAIRDALGKS